MAYQYMKARSNSIAFLFDHTDILRRSPTPYQQNPIPGFSKQASPNTDSNQLLSQQRKKKTQLSEIHTLKTKNQQQTQVTSTIKNTPSYEFPNKNLFFYIQQRKIFRLSHHHFGRNLTPTERENAFKKFDARTSESAAAAGPASETI